MTKITVFALLGALLLAASLAAYPTVTIRQIQEVPVGQDSSNYAGDTVHTGGVVTAGTGLYYAGTGVTFYLEMSSGGPWSGIMAYNVSATGFPTLIPGDSIAFDALVSEYGWTGGRFCTMTELDIVPGTFQFGSFGNPEPTPLLIPSAEWIDSTGNADTLGEQFEGVYCRLNNLTVDTVIVYSTTSTWICHDSTGHHCLVREASDSISFLPPQGAVFAYVQGVVYHRFGAYCLQPRYVRDMALPTGAPIISNVYHTPTNPIYVSAGDVDTVRVTANVIDSDSVTAVWLKYRFNLGSWQSVSMIRGTNNYWSFTFPTLPVNYRVDYYIKAQDIDNDTSKNPDQAPISFYQFRIQSPRTMTIAEARADANFDFVPDMIDSAVILYGVASSFNFTTTTTTDFYMQDGQAGIDVFLGSATFNVNLRDSVKVTGVIGQYYGKTEVIANKISRIQTLGANKLFDTLRVNCGQLGDSVGEAIEGRLIMLLFANVVDGPDSWPALGSSATMTITDQFGSAALRIDRSTNIPGQIRPTLPQQIVGVIGQYDVSPPYMSGYQLMPRRYADFQNSQGIDNELVLPNLTSLNQNYPNPFNSNTIISFNLAKPGSATLAIFDLLGRKVYENTKTNMPAGNASLIWNGSDFSGKAVSSGVYFYRLNAGSFSETKRMLLLK
jgi:hypothetical protein